MTDLNFIFQIPHFDLHLFRFVHKFSPFLHLDIFQPIRSIRFSSNRRSSGLIGLCRLDLIVRCHLFNFTDIKVDFIDGKTPIVGGKGELKNGWRLTWQGWHVGTIGNGEIRRSPRWKSAWERRGIGELLRCESRLNFFPGILLFVQTEIRRPHRGVQERFGEGI